MPNAQIAIIFFSVFFSVKNTSTQKKNDYFFLHRTETEQWRNDYYKTHTYVNNNYNGH